LAQKTKNMDLKVKLDDLKYHLYDTENFYTIDWLDLETIQYADKFKIIFKEKYNIYLDLLFIVLMGVEFMSERMECPSCPVSDNWFEEFELWLVNK
jgi:hypothetical protein